MKSKFAIVFSLFVLVGCGLGGGNRVVVEPVTPESLLDLSSERVTFSLELDNSSDELTEWINNDQPTRAELYCSDSSSNSCSDAQNILVQFGVPYEQLVGKDSGSEAVLLYDRIFTRDCEGQPQASGCSVAANQVQMVVDPRQFLDPALLDLQDAEKATGVYKDYLGNKSE